MMDRILFLMCCAVLLFSAYAMYGASTSLQKVSEDYRDAWQRFASQEQRANYELEQLAKDRVRIREILKRMEKRNGP